jgi:hypothetical protein
MPSSHPSVDPWQATGLEGKAIPIWRAVMYELVPNEVRPLGR